MALTPENARHAEQIIAGATGRKKGHQFEKKLAHEVGELSYPLTESSEKLGAVLIESVPAIELMKFIIAFEGLSKARDAGALWLGGLATSGEGDELQDLVGNTVTASKSDVLVSIEHAKGVCTTGVSVKTCNKKTPTNDQLYFTTAVAFCRLLRNNSIRVSETAEVSMRMFCGDAGFRPEDKPKFLEGRSSDPSRWFWEELPDAARREWESIFRKKQKEISLILLQKAYQDDPYPPSYLLHQRCAFTDPHLVPLAIFRIEHLASLSEQYRGFETRPYKIRKGRFKGDPNDHLAPRFGIIQFQRGGQKQHPTQLQFNLEAAYFNKLGVPDCA